MALFDGDINLLIILSVMIILLVILDGWSKNCPKPDCRRWWARRFMGEEKIEQENSFKTVKRVRTIRDPDGKIIRTEEYYEQVPIILGKYRDYYRCRFCGHQWNDIYVKYNKKLYNIFILQKVENYY